MPWKSLCLISSFFQLSLGFVQCFCFVLFCFLFVCLFVFFLIKVQGHCIPQSFLTSCKINFGSVAALLFFPLSCLELEIFYFDALKTKLAHSTPKGLNNDLCQFASLLTVLKEKKIQAKSSYFQLQGQLPLMANTFCLEFASLSYQKHQGLYRG